MPKEKEPRNPLLIKILAKLDGVEIHEAHIPREPGFGHIYAKWEPSGKVTINPVPHVVDSLLHEMAHEVFPAYTEIGVRSLVGKLMKQLSDEELQTIYDEYRKRVHYSERLQMADQEREDAE